MWGLRSKYSGAASWTRQANHCAVTVMPDGLQTPTLATALITTAVGIAGVRGLLISDLTTDNDTSPLGVTLAGAAGNQFFLWIEGVQVNAKICDTPLTTVAPELVKLR